MKLMTEKLKADKLFSFEIQIQDLNFNESPNGIGELIRQFCFKTDASTVANLFKQRSGPGFTTE